VSDTVINKAFKNQLANPGKSIAAPSAAAAASAATAPTASEAATTPSTGYVNNQTKQQLDEYLKYEQALLASPSSEEADNVIAQASAAGYGFSQAIKSSVKDRLENSTQAKINAPYFNRLKSATTQNELDQIQAQAKAAGATLDDTYFVGRASQIKQEAYNKTPEGLAEIAAAKNAPTAAAVAGPVAPTQTDGSAYSQQQLDAIKSAAEAAGFSLDTGFVKQAQESIDAAVARKTLVDTQQAAAAAQRQAEAARQAQEKQVQAEQQAQTAAQKQALQLGEKYTESLAGVTTQAELDTIVQQAQAEGATLNQGYVEQAQTIIGQTQQRAQDAEQQRLQQEYNNALVNANTPEQVDDIVKLAQQAGVELDQGYVDRGREIGTQTQARAAAEAAAARPARAPGTTRSARRAPLPPTRPPS
jgi:hypothetical protein